MAKINFKCSECGNQSWFKVNLETYVVSVKDLVCDDCNPMEEEAASIRELTPSDYKHMYKGN